MRCMELVMLPFLSKTALVIMVNGQTASVFILSMKERYFNKLFGNSDVKDYIQFCIFFLFLKKRVLNNLYKFVSYFQKFLYLKSFYSHLKNISFAIFLYACLIRPFPTSPDILAKKMLKKSLLTYGNLQFNIFLDFQ